MHESLEHELASHAQALRALARLLVGEQHADDLVQDTALQALAGRPERGSGLRGWLFAVLRHRAGKQRRGERRRRAREAAAPAPEPAIGPAEIAAQREAVQRLHDALMSAAEPYRGTLLLRFFEDLTPTAIAARTGVPLATVKSRLQRGLALLRERLDADGGRGDWRAAFAGAFGIGHALSVGGAAATTGALLMGTGVKLTLGGVAVALVAVSALWWRDDRADPRSSSPSIIASVDAASARPGPAANGDASAAPQRTTVAAGGSTASPPAAFATWRLRFVAAGTRQPLADAEIHWMDALFDPRRLDDADRRLESLDQERFQQRYGRREQADDAGRLELRTQENYVDLTARAGDRYAQAHVAKDSAPDGEGPFAGEHVIELAIDRELTLRAVDAQGDPVAGARIALRTNYKVPGAEGRSMLDELEATDARGLTTLRHSQALFARATTLTATVAVGLVEDEGPAVSVDLRDPPVHAIDVPAPASGSLDVALQWPDGRPWTLPPTGSRLLIVHRPDAISVMVHANRNSFDFGRDGHALVPRVPCGKQLVLDAGAGFAETTVDGPAHAGECRHIELRLSDQACLLSGRVLRADRTPFAGNAVLFATNRRGWSSSTLVTGADGRFLEPLPDFVVKEPVSSLAVQRRDNRGRLADETAIPLRSPLRPGINDVGDLVLAPTPILVAGRLVDATGRPAANLGVEVECAMDASDAWQQVANGQAQVADDGRFEVRSLPRARRYRLVVRGDIAPLAPIEFAAGTEDLVVRVARGGSITATFLADSMEGVRVRLGGAPVAGEDPFTRRARESPDTARPDRVGDEPRFRAQWHGLAPGLHRLVVECSGVPPAFELVVQVPPGGDADDPRLHDIDLRQRIRHIEVEVVDAAGTPLVDEVRVLVHGGDPDGDWYGQEPVAGSRPKARFALTQPVELVVLAKGCRARALARVFADTRVALDPAPTVTLELAALAALPAGVTASLHCGAVASPTASRPMAVVDRRSGSSWGEVSQTLVADTACVLDHGRASWRCGDGAPVAVTLVLRVAGRPVRRLSVQPATVDPAQLRDGEVLALACDAEALRTALADLVGK